MKYFTLFVCLTIYPLLYAQSEIRNAWESYKQSEFTTAYTIAKGYPDSDSAQHLIGNIHQLKGEYAQAISAYQTIQSNYSQYSEVVNSLITIALFHTKDIQKAKALITSVPESIQRVYAQAIQKPISVSCSGQFIVPMLTEHPLNNYIPFISGQINGIPQDMAFDTGGNFIIMSKRAAQQLNVEYDSTLSFIGKQGFGESEMYVGIIKELALGKVTLSSVPVTILEEMNTDIIIFGTNILAEFLTTIDYPNQKFIFTTLDQKALLAKHKQQYSGHQMPFYLWGDHYMMGSGEYNQQKVNMFFDSGLVVVGQIDNAITQSWMCLSPSSMLNLGIEEHENTSQRSVTGTNDTITFAGVSHSKVALSANSGTEFKFGGVYCDLLISHGILKRYAWTIDFRKREFQFR